jgi:transposase
MSKPRRKFTEEYKAEVVALCQASDRSWRQVARDLGLAESVVARWVKKAQGNKAPAQAKAEGLSGAEREELLRLRKENQRLRMEREILKKATAFFATESM